jgi:hypothetical protein
MGKLTGQPIGLIADSLEVKSSKKFLGRDEKYDEKIPEGTV